MIWTHTYQNWALSTNAPHVAHLHFPIDQLFTIEMKLNGMFIGFGILWPGW